MICLRLVEIADALAGRGGLMIVDEAFADTVPEQSLAPLVRPGLLVLRSFGKFFGLAGLRLGFGIADLHAGPSAAFGCRSLGRQRAGSDDWAGSPGRSRLDHGDPGALGQGAAALDVLLTRASLSVAGGTHLFRLVNAPRAWALYEYFGQRGILVRPFSASPRWLRFGLPPDEQSRARLAKALAGWME